jgi:hypothetical protein
MNIDKLKFTYEKLSDELREDIINVIRHTSREFVDVLKFRGIITKENAETLIEFFNSIEEDTAGECKQCHEYNFKECRRCISIEDLIIYLEKNKKKKSVKLMLLMTLDNLEEATWGQKTTFTITELSGE